MWRSVTLILIVALTTGCNSVYELKTRFADSPIPPPPDYSKPGSWAALPDKKDAADSIPLKSNLKDGQASAKADVFFVYPTTYIGKPKNQYIWNAAIDDAVIVNKTQVTTILNQASVFNGSCRIYAPYYRQANLYAFYAKHVEDGEQSLTLGYEDVKKAFEYYLKNYNHGRPIIIASHSQGSYHCERLLKDYFDGKELQKQLVMAYVVGRAIRTDAFPHIRPTEKPDEIGVWASWNTFTRPSFPDNYNKYYTHALSTNPLLWNSSEEFAPKELNHGGAAQHFTFVPQLVDAQNNKHILWIHQPYVKGRWLLHRKRWHIADINFFYMNIRENVALRIDKYLEKNGSTKDAN